MPSTGVSAETQASGERTALIAIVVLVAALFVFAFHAVPNNGFHFDDEPNIVEQQAVHPSALDLAALETAARGGSMRSRPLANMSFAVDWYRGSGMPRAFLWTNLVIHGVNAVLVFFLLGAVVSSTGAPPERARLAAAIGAGIWTLHDTPATPLR